jgi:hypothetical protein
MNNISGIFTNNSESESQFQLLMTLKALTTLNSAGAGVNNTNNNPFHPTPIGNQNFSSSFNHIQSYQNMSDQIDLQGNIINNSLNRSNHNTYLAFYKDQAQYQQQFNLNPNQNQNQNHKSCSCPCSCPTPTTIICSSNYSIPTAKSKDDEILNSNLNSTNSISNNTHDVSKNNSNTSFYAFNIFNNNKTNMSFTLTDSQRTITDESFYNNIFRGGKNNNTSGININEYFIFEPGSTRNTTTFTRQATNESKVKDSVCDGGNSSNVPLQIKLIEMEKDCEGGKLKTPLKVGGNISNNISMSNCPGGLISNKIQESILLLKKKRSVNIPNLGK